MVGSDWFKVACVMLAWWRDCLLMGDELDAIIAVELSWS